MMLLRAALLLAVAATRAVRACPAGQCSRGDTCCTFPCGDCDNCEACHAGKYCASAWPADDERAKCSRAEVPCPAGKSSAAGADACTPCAVGRYSAATATSCTACPAGTYAPLTGAADRCRDCASGTFSSDAGATACTACAIGKQSNARSSSCVDCPAGQYIGATAASSCIDCEAGRSQPAEGAASCLACDPGRFMDTAGSAGPCADCPAGTFVSTAEATACVDCDLGTHQPSRGANAQTDCGDCVVGRYHDLSNANHHLNSTACAVCPAGRTTSGPKRFHENSTVACDGCPPGKLGTDDGLCEDCPRGRYAAVPASTVCVPCTECVPAVTFDYPDSCPGGGSTDRQCTECTICDDREGYQTQACMPNQDTQCAVCDSCYAGTSFVSQECIADQNRDCAECSFPDGCATTEWEASACAPVLNSWQDRICDTCTNCTDGQFEVAGCDGQDRICETCTNCTEGQYETLPCTFDTNRQCSECDTCAAGTMQTRACSPANRECQPCSPGTYQPEINQDECIECPTGRFQLDAGQGACVDCGNRCNGHGTCSHVGICTCDPGFEGEGCELSLVPTPASTPSPPPPAPPPRAPSPPPRQPAAEETSAAEENTSPTSVAVPSGARADDRLSNSDGVPVATAEQQSSGEVFTESSTVQSEPADDGGHALWPLVAALVIVAGVSGVVVSRKASSQVEASTPAVAPRSDAEIGDGSLDRTNTAAMVSHLATKDYGLSSGIPQPTGDDTGAPPMEQIENPLAPSTRAVAADGGAAAQQGEMTPAEMLQARRGNSDAGVATV
jgi:hypothetical protein